MLPSLASFTPTGRRHIARLWLIAAVVVAALGTLLLLHVSAHSECVGCDRHDFADDTNSGVVTCFLLLVAYAASRVASRSYAASLAAGLSALVVGGLAFAAARYAHGDAVLTAAAQLYLVVSVGLAVSGVVLAIVDPILHVLERRARARDTNLPEARVVERD